MNINVTDSQSEEQIELMKALTIFRMVVISFFLGLLVLFQREFSELQFPFMLSILAAATYLVSIVYLMMLKMVSKYPLFLISQLAIDIIIETAIIFFAGGVASPFTFLYMFTIIASAIVLPRPSTYVIASVASILYGVMGNLEYYEIIQPTALFALGEKPLSQGFVFFTVLSHIAAFFLIAYLSDILSQKVRRTFLALLSKSRDLSSLQAFHENVIANMGSGFLALNMKKEVMSANNAAIKLLALPMQDLKHTSFYRFFPNNQNNTLLPEIKSKETGTVNAEVEYLSQNGEKRLLNMNCSLYKDSTQNVMGYIVIFQDVTELSEMKKTITKAEKLASIGRISAGLAHEIRNPLGSISGSVELLKSGTIKSESAQKLMSIILLEIDRLNSTITRFLSFSSIEIKRVKHANIAKIINDALLLFCNDKKYCDTINVATKMDESLELEADSEALKQVFWNLLINSGQAMENGGEISISVFRETNKKSGAEECIITFSDTGDGIPESDITKIFEPFFTTKKKGTGLGLSAVFNVIESHHGTIDLSGKDGGGTTFTISLPI